MRVQATDCGHLQIPLITTSIEAALLTHNQLLYRSISNQPSAWIDFAYRVRSRPIFREALIHTAGCYNTDRVQEALPFMNDGVARVVKEKGERLTLA